MTERVMAYVCLDTDTMVLFFPDAPKYEEHRLAWSSTKRHVDISEFPNLRRLSQSEHTKAQALACTYAARYNTPLRYVREK